MSNYQLVAADDSIEFEVDAPSLQVKIKTKTVEFETLEDFRQSEVAHDYVLIRRAVTDGPVVNMALENTGTTGGTPTTAGNLFSALAGGEAINAAGIGYSLSTGQEVNASMFGVIGDDSTDNTTNLQLFVDYLESKQTTGKILDGTYQFDTLTIDTDLVAIEGTGIGKCILKSKSTSGNAITVKSSVVSLSGFLLDATAGRTAGSGKGIVLDDGVHSNTQNRNKLRNIQINNQPGDGLYMRCQEIGLFENINSSNNGGYGCYSDAGGVNYGTSNTFLNLRCRNNGSVGIYESGMTGNTYINPQALDNQGTQDMRIDTGYGTVIINPDIENTGSGAATRGLQVAGSYVKVLGGLINGNYTYGMLLSNAKECLIENPRLQASSSMTYGIHLNDSGCVRNHARVTNATNVGTLFNNFTTYRGNTYDEGVTAYFKRLATKAATDHVAGDYALSAGWGSTASISAVSAVDNRGQFTVTSAGTGQGANPTITLTFKDGAYAGGKPFFSIVRNGGDQLTVTQSWTTTTTTLVITWAGTPVAGQTYTFEFVGVG